jgi:predicted lysophospholipase L1 biosynthesis ABC-type transport system permease subunit
MRKPRPEPRMADNLRIDLSSLPSPAASCHRRSPFVRSRLWQCSMQSAMEERTHFCSAVPCSFDQPRFASQLLALFAALALMLASVGLYGLTAYSVTQRRNEIGMRMALGARREDILSLVLRQGLMLALTGIGLGLIASLLMTRVVSSVLFCVGPTDGKPYWRSCCFWQALRLQHATSQLGAQREWILWRPCGANKFP